MLSSCRKLFAISAIPVLWGTPLWAGQKKSPGQSGPIRPCRGKVIMSNQALSNQALSNQALSNQALYTALPRSYNTSVLCMIGIGPERWPAKSLNSRAYDMLRDDRALMQPSHRVLLALLVTAVAVMGQASTTQPARPQSGKQTPKAPKKEPSGAAKRAPTSTASVSVTSDLPCSFSVDGKHVADIHSGEPMQLSLSLADHTLEAVSSASPQDRWEGKIDLTNAPEKPLVRIELLSIQNNRVEAERKAAEPKRVAFGELFVCCGNDGPIKMDAKLLTGREFAQIFTDRDLYFTDSRVQTLLTGPDGGFVFAGDNGRSIETRPFGLRLEPVDQAGKTLEGFNGRFRWVSYDMCRISNGTRTDVSAPQATLKIFMGSSMLRYYALPSAVPLQELWLCIRDEKQLTKVTVAIPVCSLPGLCPANAGQ